MDWKSGGRNKAGATVSGRPLLHTSPLEDGALAGKAHQQKPVKGS